MWRFPAVILGCCCCCRCRCLPQHLFCCHSKKSLTSKFTLLNENLITTIPHIFHFHTHLPVFPVFVFFFTPFCQTQHVYMGLRFCFITYLLRYFIFYFFFICVKKVTTKIPLQYPVTA